MFNESDILQDERYYIGVKLIKAQSGKQQMTFIPYYAWDNREAGQMKVWIDYQE